MIRTAKHDDLNRIAEIEVFNYRLKFYPIFLDDEIYRVSQKLWTYSQNRIKLHR